MATIATLRKGIQHDCLQGAWNRTVGSDRKGLHRCPECSTLMCAIPTDGPEIDLCRLCQMIWFDADELGQLPKRSSGAIKRDQWQEELRQMQKRREDREYYARIAMRRVGVGF